MRSDLPAAQAFARPQSYASELDAKVVQGWNYALRPAAAVTGTVIDIFDVIGEDPWSGDGVTAKFISQALKGAGDVTVNINSPGGDFFEGLAIYNLLRGHGGTVTVNILGMAASAASLIAMAGNQVFIADAAYIMIHNVWGLVAGNQFDLQTVIDQFKAFDQTIVAIYAKNTGLSNDQIAEMMKATTWLSGPDAINQGFADDLLPPDTAVEDTAVKERLRALNAVRVLDTTLATHTSMSRTERRDLISSVRHGTHDAAAPRQGMHAAAPSPATQDAGLAALLSSINSLTKTLSV